MKKKQHQKGKKAALDFILLVSLQISTKISTMNGATTGETGT